MKKTYPYLKMMENIIVSTCLFYKMIEV